MGIFEQALLVSLFVTIAFIDSHTFQTHIFRPIVVGPIVGLIMGDTATGFAVGVSIELMFLAVIFVGTATPPDSYNFYSNCYCNCHFRWRWY